MRKIVFFYALAFFLITLSLVPNFKPTNRIALASIQDSKLDMPHLYLDQKEKPLIQSTTSLVANIGVETTFVFELKNSNKAGFWEFIGLPAGFRVLDADSKSLVKIVTGTPTTAGTFGLVINVANKAGKITASGNFPVVINSQQLGDFNLQLGQAIPKLKAGQAVSTTIFTNGVNGFQGSINLSVQTVSDITTSFSQQAVNAGSSSELKITADKNARAGTYEIIITGQSGSLSRSLKTSVVVENSPPANANPKIITLKLPDAVISQPYSTRIQADINFDPAIHRFTFVSRDHCARDRFTDNSIDGRTGEFSGFPVFGAICSYEFQIVKANETNVVLDSAFLSVLIPETIIRDFPASVSPSSFRIGDTLTATWNSKRVDRTTVYLFNFTQGTPFVAISILPSSIGVVEQPQSGQNSIRWSIPATLSYLCVLRGCNPERFVVRVFIHDPSSPIGVIFTQTDEFKIDF